MTPQRVNQVQASFIKVAQIANRAAALFYGRLFQTAPETRALFRGDMDTQRRKLMSALATVVNSLGDFDASSPSHAISQSVTSLMVSRPSIIRSSSPLCCGPWNRGSPTNSLSRCARLGKRRIPPYRR